MKCSDTQISSVNDDIIHCIEVVSGNKLPFVFIPGYDASGALYYKMMYPLSQKYNLYFVDMRGMGWYF